MIQSSAVSISIAIDNSRHFEKVKEELHKHYKVTYNEGLELVSIRGDRDNESVETLIKREESIGNIFLSQCTRRFVKLLRKHQSEN